MPEEIEKTPVKLKKDDICPPIQPTERVAVASKKSFGERLTEMSGFTEANKIDPDADPKVTLRGFCLSKGLKEKHIVAFRFIAAKNGINTKRDSILHLTSTLEKVYKDAYGG